MTQQQPASKKGIYTEYLDARLNFEGSRKERKRLLEIISKLRGDRAVLAFAADFSKAHTGAPISITYSDLVPFNDQISVLEGDKIDIILETPGGLGEVTEDIVKLMRRHFNEIGVIVPGHAKSAGTLLAMAGDEILMEPASSLGPIDAQISHQGKQFSAEAFITGLDKIKEEVTNTGTLNKAYIPILQAISPGEIQHAENALKFAKILVTDWLATYKFRNWDKHSSTGQPVTPEDRRSRAEEIADKLADHSKWLTHGRSLKIEDLRAMKLHITDYSEMPELADAIRRYFVLLQMTFGSTGVYKIFETPKSEIVNLIAEETVMIQPPPQQPGQRHQQPQRVAPQNAETVDMDFPCPNCRVNLKIQANLNTPKPIQPGKIGFPADNRLKCPNCNSETNMTGARQHIEALARKKIV